MEKCHPWISSMDGEISSMDGEMSSIDESVIRGYHLWMTHPSVDVIHGWMETMDDGHGQSKNCLNWCVLPNFVYFYYTQVNYLE